MADILEIESKFYPLLVRYLEQPAMAATIAMDEAEAACELFLSRRRGWRSRSESAGITVKQARALQGAVAAYMQEADGAPLARWILELPEDPAQDLARSFLSEVAMDAEFAAYNRLKLLISYWAASRL
jgi:hypothetical protein